MTPLWQRLDSREDASVNFIQKTPDQGAWEARYVQRQADYAIAYLSSHTGCKHACRFCHLTATGQTMMQPATLEDFVRQAEQVLAVYRERREQGMPAIDRLHFNFMARGEALSNPSLCQQSQAVFQALRAVAGREGITQVKFLVSTIYPRDFTGNLAESFSDPDVILYYSLYSMNPAFRKRWLGQAHPAEIALDAIASYQQTTGNEVVLHWAFIEGANDQDESIDAIAQAVTARGLRVRFNLVRYNPHDQRHGQEPTEARLQQLFDRLGRQLNNPNSRIVPRVGRDVYASCGMFWEGDL